MGIVESLKHLSDVRKSVEEQSRKQAMEILRPGLVQFLADHADVRAFRWTQYAPHFNDGDECVFGVHDLEYLLVGTEPGEGEEEEDEDPDGEWENASPRARSQTGKDLYALDQALQGSEDELREAFGNHVRVTVTRKGVVIEEYDHD
jgi:hypothetical protein